MRVLSKTMTPGLRSIYKAPMGYTGACPPRNNFRALSSAQSPDIATTQADQNTRSNSKEGPNHEVDNRAIAPKKKKTMAELDEELRLKLEGMSGDGGSAGVEYEGGKSEGLKRGVKANMFRVI